MLLALIDTLEILGDLLKRLISNVSNSKTFNWIVLGWAELTISISPQNTPSNIRQKDEQLNYLILHTYGSNVVRQIPKTLHYYLNCNLEFHLTTQSQQNCLEGAKRCADELKKQ